MDNEEERNAKNIVWIIYECHSNVVLMSERIERFRNKFRKWKEVFESKGLKVNF